MNTQLMMARGTAAMLNGLNSGYTDRHRQLTISQDEYETVTQVELWEGGQLLTARSALNKFVNGSLTLSGIPAMPCTAEYVATVIAAIVCPANWQIASTFFNTFEGTQMVTNNGDVAQAREVMKPEKLFAMVLTFAESVKEWAPRNFNLMVQAATAAEE